MTVIAGSTLLGDQSDLGPSGEFASQDVVVVNDNGQNQVLVPAGQPIPKRHLEVAQEQGAVRDPDEDPPTGTPEDSSEEDGLADLSYDDLLDLAVEHGVDLDSIEDGNTEQLITSIRAAAAEAPEDGKAVKPGEAEDKSVKAPGETKKAGSK